MLSNSFIVLLDLMQCSILYCSNEMNNTPLEHERSYWWCSKSHRQKKHFEKIMEDEKNFLFSCEEESRNTILSGTLENSLRKGETQGKWRTDFFWQTSKKVRDWGKHLWWPITVFLMIWCYNNITKRELMLILKKSPVWVRISWYYLLILFSRSDSNSLRGPKWIWRLQIKNGHCAAHSQGVRPWGYKKNLKRQGFCYATLPTVAQTTQGCPKNHETRMKKKVL